MKLFDREQLRPRIAALAAAAVYIGTSSWKYPGWMGQLYTAGRYEYRGKLAKTRFERNSLVEYAEVFKTVCVDAAYYTFPGLSNLERMASQVPSDFRFAFKVTDTITLKRFPNLDRFGPLAGSANPDFLNADLFTNSFLNPCDRIRPKLGLIMFEFSRFWPVDYKQGREFIADLDNFLSRLPPSWPYAIELRNRNWLQPDYFDCLARHRVAHVFNSWEAMPPVSAQLELPHSRPRSDLVAARFLLKPGRSYEEAVEAFHPYEATKEVNAEARQAGASLITEGLHSPGRETYVYVNNRLEGNALSTIEAMVGLAISENS